MGDHTTASALGPILEYGLLGSLFVFMSWYAYKTTKALNKILEQRTKDVQEMGNKRTDDAQKVTQQLLELSDRWNGTINQQVQIVKAQTEAFREIKNTMEKVRDRMIGCKHNTGGS